MKLPTNEGPRVDEVGGFIVPSSAGSTGTANRCNQERKRVLHRFDAPVQRSLVSKSDRTTSISSRRRGRKRSQPEGQELTAMDYSLPAVKMHIAQLKPAKPAKELRPNGGVAFTLGSLVFQRAWLQGVLVQGLDKASLALQDETGLLPIHLAAGDPGTIGAYVLLVGQYMVGSDGSPLLLVHKIVDLTSCPHRDEFWRLEVAEAHKLFYDKLINSPTH